MNDINFTLTRPEILKITGKHFFFNTGGTKMYTNLIYG